MLHDEVTYAQRQGRFRRQLGSTTSTQTTTIPQVTSSYSSPTSTITSLAVNASSSNASLGQLMTSSAYEAGTEYCTVALPSGGLIQLNDSTTLQLDDTVSFQAPCANNSIFNAGSGNSSLIIPDDPFYASIAPQVYVLAATTVISYLLVIILFITPRTFYIGGPAGSGTSLGGGSGLLGRGITFIGTGSSTSGAVGIGRRPLLQKIATITVAISLTIATSDTFDVAKSQYDGGYIAAKVLVQQVIGSQEIRVTRVISDAFLWLAQVQTLIRLFPRHKEKVTIKWLGFGLVTCDIVFSSLENFVSGSNRTSPETFKDAIPALSYLFELSISLIYASCVVYYALSKRRFAFWHSKMRNVCLVALMSLTAILIPVVFFIVDVAQPEIATWGEYIRWVGAAAASVVVWEWVERIEALERDEKKDGILGREIFDGDEMIDVSHSGDKSFDEGSDPYSPDPNGGTKTKKTKALTRIKNLELRPRVPFKMRRKGLPAAGTTRKASIVVANGTVTRPPQAVTPISRSDTNSAASTVYAVRYHSVLSPSPAIPENDIVHIEPQEMDPSKEVADVGIPANMHTIAEQGEDSVDEQGPESRPAREAQHDRHVWHSVANPFKRKRAEPPAEVAAQIAESNQRRSPAAKPLNLRARFGAFATTQKERFSGRQKNRTPLQVTVIPAQPRESRAESLDESAIQSLAERGLHIEPVPNTAASAEEDITPQQSSLPVTVIPAPIKGARTWSPDDMIDASPEDRHGSGSSTSSNSQNRSSTRKFRTSTPSRSVRATPPIRSSPSHSATGQGLRATVRVADINRNRGSTTASSLSERIRESPALTADPAILMYHSANGEVAGTPSPANTSQQIPDHSSIPNTPSVTITSSHRQSNDSNSEEHRTTSPDLLSDSQGHQPVPSKSGPGRPANT